MKKINNTISLRRQIFRDELRTLCINKEWYSLGNIKQYDNLFDRLSRDMDDVEIIGVCIDIYDHTDVEQFAQEYGVSYEEVFDNIVYEVYELVHTFVER